MAKNTSPPPRSDLPISHFLPVHKALTGTKLQGLSFPFLRTILTTGRASHFFFFIQASYPSRPTPATAAAAAATQPQHRRQQQQHRPLPPAAPATPTGRGRRPRVTLTKTTATEEEGDNLSGTNLGRRLRSSLLLLLRIRRSGRRRRRRRTPPPPPHPPRPLPSDPNWIMSRGKREGEKGEATVRIRKVGRRGRRERGGVGSGGGGEGGGRRKRRRKRRGTCISNSGMLVSRKELQNTLLFSFLFRLMVTFFVPTRQGSATVE